MPIVSVSRDQAQVAEGPDYRQVGEDSHLAVLLRWRLEAGLDAPPSPQGNFCPVSSLAGHRGPGAICHTREIPSFS